MYKTYINNGKILAGMTLKNKHIDENNNMALHSCDNPEAILKNRKKLANEIGLSLEHFVCPNQTHSDQFYKVTKKDAGRGAFVLDNAIESVDALYTFEKNIVLCTFSADCVPMMFYHSGTNIIGVIHSGWQGTVQEIAKKTFRHLMVEENCTIDGFQVVIGPSICQANFEVDQDVANQYKLLKEAKDLITYDENKKKYFIPNQIVVKEQLKSLGMTDSQIIVDETCTFDTETCFSHRKTKTKGRHMSFIRRI